MSRTRMKRFPDDVLFVFPFVAILLIVPRVSLIRDGLVNNLVHKCDMPCGEYVAMGSLRPRDGGTLRQQATSLGGAGES